MFMPHLTENYPNAKLKHYDLSTCINLLRADPLDHRESHQCLLFTLKFKLPTHLTKPSWKAKVTLLIINI